MTLLAARGRRRAQSLRGFIGIVLQMLQKVLQSILRRYFGEFIAGLENVQLAFWTGKIHIQNASLRDEKINELLKIKNIPFLVKFSFLGSLQLDIPWNKLSSAPVEIKLSNVYIVLSLEKMSEAMQVQQRLQQNAKLLLIKNYVSYIQKKSEELKNDAQKDSGFLKKLMIKILHNVNIHVSNIHIRVQSNVPKAIQQPAQQDQDLFYSCLGQDDKPIGFSLGLCIESIDAQTINERNQKQFVQIMSDKTAIRKIIVLKQISFYWQEEEMMNLLLYSNDRKLELLNGIIKREEHRLLTVDGTLLMEKNKQDFQYFFSTQFNVLEVKTNYKQLRQIIQVNQQFASAKTKKKLVKMKELKHELQVGLEKDYKQMFCGLYSSKFQSISLETVKLIESVDKKLLIKWTRDQCIELLKQQKLKSYKENKNKSTWLSFLSKKSQEELQLTEADIKVVEEEINKFIEIVDQKERQLSVGLSLFVKSLKLMVEHAEFNQKLLFSSDGISLNIKKSKDNLGADLSVLDSGLIYQDLKKQSGVNILKKIANQRTKLLVFSFLDNKQEQKLSIETEQLCFRHQIQFLGFISQMISLQQREEGKAKTRLFTQDSYKKQQQIQKKQAKRYDYRVRLKKIEIKLELDSKTRIESYIDGISIAKEQSNSNLHFATLSNFALVYIDLAMAQKTYKIIEDINITVKLTGLKQLKSKIPKIKIVFNQQSLYVIGNCLKEQYKLLKVRKLEYKKELIEEEQKFMEGETQIISIFKYLKVYHTVLTSDSLLFYEKIQGKTDFTKTAKEIPLQNLAIFRKDDLSFKLEAMLINEIISCKSKEDSDRWIYLIQQRIYQCSSKYKIFDMVQQQNHKQSTQALIYIPYDSTIDILVQYLQIVYLKNNTSPILRISLEKLNLLLYQNNLHFQRKIFIEEVTIKNLSLVDQHRDEFNTILSNVVNYFQDPLSDEEQEQRPSNICVLIEGKKKTHPQYTGELSIKANINRLFINYDAQFFYSILYRLVFGDVKTRAYTQKVRNQQVIKILKQLLELNNGIAEKFRKALPFEFNRSYVELQKYRQFFSSKVLFHVQLRIEQVQTYFVNGRNFMWQNKLMFDRISVQIDKSTQFIFLKGRAKDMAIYDLTGYPFTNKQPFTHGQAYPIVYKQSNSKNNNIAQFYAGMFEPMLFINRERFKNFFQMNLFDLAINYQQQPLLRFNDFLTNQAILFILQPFFLHKYDTPERGPFSFGHLNFTEAQIRKILKQAIYPSYTNLRIHLKNLEINFNSFPKQQAIRFNMPVVSIISHPNINNQRVHVKLDLLKKFQNDYPTLALLHQDEERFESLVTKFQWATKYLISAERCTCDIFQNQFSYDMYFQKANNVEKDILLPFIKIDKDFAMQGAIKSLNITAGRKVYNLINKCFNFNLSYDDGLQPLFITNHKYQHLNEPARLLYSLKIGQLSYLIPQLDRTVIVVPSCQYKFQKNQQAKSMTVLGRSLYIFDSTINCNIIKPINFDQPKGLSFAIDMLPSGEKVMYCSMKQIELTYNNDKIMALIRYFIVDDSCYPKQQVYQDIPLIRCEADILNSYVKIAEVQENVYVLKGDNIKVVWTRNKGPHPQQYKRNKDLYPNNAEANSYDIKLEKQMFCKYSAAEYQKKSRLCRPLSNQIRAKIKFTNIMKRNLDLFYTDMLGTYQIQNLQLKICYKDFLQLQLNFQQSDHGEEVFSSPEIQREKRRSIVNQNQLLGYIPHTYHLIKVNRFVCELGLSELPVPLLAIAVEKSEMKLQLLGTSKISTNKLQLTIDYWNMLIGRWQPLLQKSYFDVTVKLDKDNYYSIASDKAILLDFSTQSLKVLKLLSEDFAEKGNARILSHEGRRRDKQVSPYAITNRTGYSLIMINLQASEGVNSNKIRSNETMHIRSKNNEISTKEQTVNYEIEGDSTEHKINLNMVEAEQKKVTYNQSQYFLFFHVISSPILKEIVISSSYVIHNKTAFKLHLEVGTHQYSAEPDKKVAIPFTVQMLPTKRFRLRFPHLTFIKENQEFKYSDLLEGYEHKIIFREKQCLYCNVDVDSNLDNTITIAPLSTIVNLTPLTIRAEMAVSRYKGSKSVINQLLQVSKQKVFYEFGSKDDVSVRLKLKGFNFSSFQKMGLGKLQAQAEEQSKFMLPDHHGLQSYIKYRISKKGYRNFIYLFSQCLLINESSYNVYLFEGAQLLSGQRIENIPESESKYVFINEAKQLSIGFRADDPTETQKISLQELGNQYINVAFEGHLYQLVVNSSVHCIEEEMQLFTRMLKLTPRHILINNCLRNICLRQIRTDQRVVLQIKERINWHWHSKDEARLLTLAATDNQFQLADGWDFSNPIQLENIEETVLVLRPKVHSPQRLLIKVEIVKETQFTFVIFNQLKNSEDSLITFKNNMKLVSLQIHQHFLDDLNTPWADFKHFECPPSKQTPFGWDFPKEEHIVGVQFNFLGSLRTKFNDDIVVIDLNRLVKPIVVEFDGQQGNTLEIEVSLELIGIRKKIIFGQKDDQSSRQNEEQMSEISGNKMGVSFPYIGISLIGGRKPRSEIIYISIKYLDLIMMQKQNNRGYELKIKYINIDNNSNHNTIYPVLLTPLTFKKIDQKKRPFFVCLIQQNLKSQQITEINYFKMAIEPISFKLYDEIISKLYDMQKELKSLNEKERKVDLCQTFRSHQPQAQWQVKELYKGDKSIFIRDLEIGKIIVELSFSIKPTSGGNIVLYTIVTLFKTVLSNVSESQIKLSRFNYKNVTVGQLTNQLSEFYRKEIFKEIYKIPGSINILGNPYVFVRYIAEGVWEIINQPSEGFIKGPIEGAIGVVKGGVYFTRNVVAGTCNTFQVMGQSISQGISYVTFDDKFITRRQKIQMQKSKHLGDGARSAAFAVYTGVQLAFKGIYRLPKEYMQKSGAPGFFKGVLIAVTGLFTKPLSGLFQGISKFSQGVKQTALYFQDGPNNSRSRAPRVFIGGQQYYSQYNPEQSKAINLLQFHSTKYLNKKILFVSADATSEGDDVIYTVLTDEFLVILSKNKNKILKEIIIYDITEVDPSKSEVSKQLTIKYGDNQMLVVVTQKCREMFSCFEILFQKLKDNSQLEVDSDQ